jgi:hypothetical protein
MEPIETVSTQPNAVAHPCHAANYRKVLDARKSRIRGLWQRNGSFYAQLTMTDERTGGGSAASAGKACTDGLLSSMPIVGIKPLKVEIKEQPLVTAEEIEAICPTALRKVRTGSGMRRPGSAGTHRAVERTAHRSSGERPLLHATTCLRGLVGAARQPPRAA